MNLLKQKVNIMRTLFILPLTMLMLCNPQLGAAEALKGKPLVRGSVPEAEQKKWYYPFEIGELKIKQSNDGTGIIREVSCTDCEYQFVKITPDTKVFVNGKEADLLRARERAGQDAYIEFDRETAEVKHIYWSE